MPLKTQVDPRSLSWIRVLGRGGFGTNIKAFDRDFGVCAIKFLDQQEWNPSSLEARQAVLAHVKDASRIAVPLAYGFSSAGRPIILMDCAPHGSLELLLQQKPDLTVQRRALIAKEIAEAMHYLHTKDPKIVHMNLKPSNILVFRDYQIRIGDLGLACILEEGPLFPSTSTVPYAAPEVLNYGWRVAEAPKPDTKADVFSFALVLYQLFCREQHLPFSERLQEHYGDGATHTGIEDLRRSDPMLRPTLQPPPALLAENNATEWAANVMQLIQECWAHDKERRPSFADIVQQLGDVIREMGQPPEGATGLADDWALSNTDRAMVQDWLKQQQEPQQQQQQQLWHGQWQHGHEGPGTTARSFSRPTSSSSGTGETGLEVGVWDWLKVIAAEGGPDATWVPPQDGGLWPPAEPLPVRWLRITLLLWRLRKEQPPLTYDAQQLLDEVVFRTLIGSGQGENWGQVLHLLPLSWPAADWLVGTWGSLVGPDGVVGREHWLELWRSLERGAARCVLNEGDLQKIMAAMRSAVGGGKLRLGAVLRALAQQATLAETFVDSTGYLERQQARQAKLLLTRMEKERMTDWKQQAAIIRWMKDLKRDVESVGARWPDVIFLPDKTLKLKWDAARKDRDQERDQDQGTVWHSTLGPDGALTAAKQEKVWVNLSATWAFWDNLKDQQRENLLPKDFFSRGSDRDRWLWRAKDNRLLMEPVDIARWYFCNKHSDPEMHTRYNCAAEGYHYDEGVVTEEDERTVKNKRRPSRYMLAQKVEHEQLHSTTTSMETARRFRDWFKNRDWKVVMAEREAAAGGGRDGGEVPGKKSGQCPTCHREVEPGIEPNADEMDVDSSTAVQV